MSLNPCIDVKRANLLHNKFFIENYTSHDSLRLVSGYDEQHLSNK